MPRVCVRAKKCHMYVCACTQVLIDQLTKQIRRQRSEQERASAAKQQQREDEGKAEEDEGQRGTGRCVMCLCACACMCARVFAAGRSKRVEETVSCDGECFRNMTHYLIVYVRACMHVAAGRSKRAEKTEAEEAAAKEADDIAKQLGCGSVAAVRGFVCEG